MMKIDSDFITKAIHKWYPIIKSLNFDDKLKESVSIFSELCSYEIYNSNIPINQNDYDNLILPMALKTLSRLNLERVKLVIDTEKYYKFDTYEVKIKLTQEQVQELNMQIGIHVASMLEHSIIDQIVNVINDKIEKEKDDILIINTNFIGKIQRFGKYQVLQYRFISTSIKKERRDKINNINNNIK